MVRKTVSILFIAVLIVSVLVGCGGGETTPAATNLVPEKASMIARVDLSQTTQDEDVAALYEAMPMEPGDPQTLDEALDLAREEIGLDLRDFREGLIFGEISEATGDMDYVGIVVKGTFKESDLVASIESAIEEEFTTISYKGHEIYTDPDEEGGLAFLGSDAFVIGPIEAVKDVIAVKEGDQPASSGKLSDTYNELADGLVKVALEVPPGAIEEGLQEIMVELPIPLPGLDELADMETIGMTLVKNGQSISLVSRMCFTSSESAGAVDTLISFVVSMAALPDVPEEIQELLPDVPGETRELLEEINVSLDGSCLDLSLEMTMSEFENLIESFVLIESSTQGPSPR